jgi:hypothetical protein
MNKQVGFDPKLVSLIISGQKTATWRIDDQKDLSSGDVCDLINSETGKKFATGRLTKVFQKQFKELTEDDKKGHEKYFSEEEMFKTFEYYYKKPIGPETLIKVVMFELLK